MTPAATLKPDHDARRRYDVFTEEHEDLRASVRRFVRSELTPHIDQWEETTFPNSVFARLGELGFLGLDKPEELGGEGGDYYTSIVLAEEMVHAQCGGLARRGDLLIQFS